MLLADFDTWLGGHIMTVMIVVGFYVYLIKKLFAANPVNKSAAQELATKKAVSLLQRFLK